MSHAHSSTRSTIILSRAANHIIPLWRWHYGRRFLNSLMFGWVRLHEGHPTRGQVASISLPTCLGD